jgi:hypothetical protein
MLFCCSGKKFIMPVQRLKCRPCASFRRFRNWTKSMPWPDRLPAERFLCMQFLLIRLGLRFCSYEVYSEGGGRKDGPSLPT